MKPKFDNTFSLGRGVSHDVDIILLNDDAWLQRGEGGGQKSRKTWLHNLNYVINYVIWKLLSN